MFVQTLAEISIPENSALHPKIATFVANDSDTGIAGALIWQQKLQLLVDQKVYFRVNQFTGELALIAELNYERERDIPLLVSVCDQSLLNQQCVQQSVRVVVEVTNDIAPVLDRFVFSVSESAPVGTVMDTIRATDDDSGVMTTRTSSRWTCSTMHCDSNDHWTANRWPATTLCTRAARQTRARLCSLPRGTIDVNGECANVFEPIH